MRKHTISFKNAFTGIKCSLTTQSNVRIHFLFASLALLLGLYFRIALYEATILVLTITLVLLAEMINTSLEHLADAVTGEKNEYIRMAKDVSAGAVLFTAISSLIIATIIFLPKIIALLPS